MRRLSAVLMVLAAFPVLGKHVVFVDNRASPGGNGTQASPLRSIAAAAGAEVIYVAETELPYLESVALRKGQMLVGSAFGLEVLRAELHLDLDAPPTPARQGSGPLIRGTISVAGDNVVAGCVMVVDRGSAGITGSGSDGVLTLRGMSFRTSQRGFAIFLQGHSGPVSISGGGVQASADGNGIAFVGGVGEIVVERFPLGGAFATAVRISNRGLGAVTFRNGSPIRTTDAADDAVVVADMERAAPVTFADRIQIRGRRRGFVASKVAKLVVKGGDSWLATTGGTALDLRDVTADVVFDSVSADNAAEGIVLEKVRGRLQITGRNGEPASGGTIRGAKSYGVRVGQSSNVRLANLSLVASGTNAPARGARCIGDFEVNSAAPCNAALYLRHVEASSFENLVIDGGGAMGLNAGNIRDVIFDNVVVRGAGEQSFEAGVLLQEIGGTVRFSRCTFADNAGSEVTLEQRYNNGRVTFDRCMFGAPKRPALVPRLVDIRVLGNAQLAVEIRNSELADNAGSAIAAAASAASTLSLTFDDSFAQQFGTGGLTVRASDAARVTLRMHRVHFFASPAPQLVDVDASGPSVVCIDLSGNTLAAPIHLVARGGGSLLRVVSSAGNSAGLPFALTAANGGAPVTIEAPGASVSVVTSCP